MRLFVFSLLLAACRIAPEPPTPPLEQTRMSESKKDYRGLPYEPALCERNMDGGCDNCGAPSVVECKDEAGCSPVESRIKQQGF